MEYSEAQELGDINENFGLSVGLSRDHLMRDDAGGRLSSCSFSSVNSDAAVATSSSESDCEPEVDLSSALKAIIQNELKGRHNFVSFSLLFSVKLCHPLDGHIDSSCSEPTVSNEHATLSSSSEAYPSRTNQFNKRRYKLSSLTLALKAESLNAGGNSLLYGSSNDETFTHMMRPNSVVKSAAKNHLLNSDSLEWQHSSDGTSQRDCLPTRQLDHPNSYSNKSSLSALGSPRLPAASPPSDTCNSLPESLPTPTQANMQSSMPRSSLSKSLRLRPNSVCFLDDPKRMSNCTTATTTNPWTEGERDSLPSPCDDVVRDLTLSSTSVHATYAADGSTEISQVPLADSFSYIQNRPLLEQTQNPCTSTSVITDSQHRPSAYRTAKSLGSGMCSLASAPSTSQLLGRDKKRCISIYSKEVAGYYRQGEQDYPSLADAVHKGFQTVAISEESRLFEILALLAKHSPHMVDRREIHQLTFEALRTQDSYDVTTHVKDVPVGTALVIIKRTGTELPRRRPKHLRKSMRPALRMFFYSERTAMMATNYLCHVAVQPPKGKKKSKYCTVRIDGVSVYHSLFVETNDLTDFLCDEEATSPLEPTTTSTPVSPHQRRSFQTCNLEEADSTAEIHIRSASSTSSDENNFAGSDVSDVAASEWNTPMSGQSASPDSVSKLPRHSYASLSHISGFRTLLPARFAASTLNLAQLSMNANRTSSTDSRTELSLNTCRGAFEQLLSKPQLCRIPSVPYIMGGFRAGSSVSNSEAGRNILHSPTASTAATPTHEREETPINSKMGYRDLPLPLEFPLSSVLLVELHPKKQRTLSIKYSTAFMMERHTFRNVSYADKNAQQSRVHMGSVNHITLIYKTDHAKTCAEIAAKLKYLAKMQSKSQDGKAKTPMSSMI